MSSQIAISRDMPHTRRGDARRRELPDILTIALLASARGAESCVDFAEFAEGREPLLRELLRLDFGLHDAPGGKGHWRGPSSAFILSTGSNDRCAIGSRSLSGTRSPSACF